MRKTVLGFMVYFLGFVATCHAADTVLAYRPGVPIVETSPWPSLPKQTFTNALQWARINPLTDTLIDYSLSRAEPSYAASPCTTWNGTAHLLVTGLTTNTTVVSKSGTSTPSIVAGRINFTTGTCWDLLLSNGSFYPMQEKWGTRIHDVSTNAMHGTITSGTLSLIYAATQNESHRFATHGGSKVLSLNASTTINNLTPPTGAEWAIEGWAIIRTGDTGGSLYTSAGNYVLTINPTDRKITMNTYGVDFSSADNVWEYDVPFHFVVQQEVGFRYFFVNGASVNYDNGGTPYSALTHAPDVGYYAFVGDLIRLRTWSRTLSGGEISAAVAAGPIHAGSTTDLHDDLRAWTFYGTTAPNFGTLTNATIVAPTYKHFPAAETNDVANLGILNPTGFVHNLGPHSFQNGGSELTFNGTNSFGVIPASGAFGNFGANDFTIEFDAIINGTAENQVIVGKMVGGNASWQIYGAGNLWYLLTSSTGSNFLQIEITTAGDFLATMSGKMLRYKATKTGTSVQWSVNGVNKNSGTVHETLFSTANPITISGRYTSTAYTTTERPFNGKLRNLRITESGVETFKATDYSYDNTTGQWEDLISGNNFLLTNVSKKVGSYFPNIGQSDFWTSDFGSVSRSVTDILTTTNTTITTKQNASGFITDLITEAE